MKETFNLLGAYLNRYRVRRGSIIRGWPCTDNWCGCCRFGILSSTITTLTASPSLFAFSSGFALLSTLAFTPLIVLFIVLLFVFLIVFLNLLGFWCDDNRLIMVFLYSFYRGDRKVKLTDLVLGWRSVVFGFNLFTIDKKRIQDIKSSGVVNDFLTWLFLYGK